MSSIGAGPQDAQPITAVPVRHPWRWVAGAIVLLLVAMLVNSLVTNSQFGWSIIGQYLFDRPVLDGVVTTIELTFLAMAIGIVGGVILAVMRLSPNPLLSGASWLYIWLFRGTPVLVQILLWYNVSYLYPRLSFGVPFGPHFSSVSTNSLISTFTAATLGLGLNEAAYMSEIVRAGILSVDEGQTEAAAALGMSRGLVMRRIVLPQAMRVIIPPTGNETISMLKTSSLASVIALTELLQSVTNIYNRNYLVVPLLFVACIWYLAMTTVLTIGQFYVERYFGRGSSRLPPQGGLLSRIWRALRYTRPHLRGTMDMPIGGTGGFR